MTPSSFRAPPLALALLLLLSPAAPAQTSPPVPITGAMLPGMERFDATVLGLMTKFNSPGAQLAITRGGRLALARGYGFADRDAGTPVQADALFRTASIGKFFTALAILTLVEQGKLDLEAKALPLLGLTPLPNATNLDPRVQTITVRQLLHHTGGWDRDISGDVTGLTTTIANAAGVPAPASVDLVIRYSLGLRLDFDPGSRYAYSNLGFMILGQIVQKLTGQSYEDYVTTMIFNKAGITRARPARTLLENRHPTEVRYYDYPGAPLVRSSLPPTTALVPGPYGGTLMENRYATGGWAMTAIDYVRLLGAVDGGRPGAGIITPASIDLLTERPAPPLPATGVNFYAMALNMNVANGPGLRANWFHDGAYTGTATYMARAASGWSYAIFFNSRPRDDDSVTADISAAMNAALAATTAPATGDLFTSSAPQILAPPVAQTVNAGGTATFSASITSLATPTYQWSKDGAPLAGATNATLTLASLSPADSGAYRVTVSNPAGNVTSAVATLTVPGINTAGRLINLSILTNLSGSADDFTMGYVAGGTGTRGTKPLVIRAAGPSLGALGVPDTVVDPKLELFVGATSTGQNDNWGGAPALTAAMASVGAFAYMAPTSRDAAALTTVNAGENNSVKISGTGAGTVIAELYDATPIDSFLLTTPRLLNVSVLKHLNNGLIVGFSIGGTTAAKVLVRAVGPTLGTAPFNLGGVVADPQLALFNGTTRIGENNDWGGGAALVAAFGQVGAFALPANSRDAAMLVTLEPGSYSAQVSGVNNTTGVAIVEVYEVP